MVHGNQCSSYTHPGLKSSPLHAYPNPGPLEYCHGRICSPQERTLTQVFRSPDPDLDEHFGPHALHDSPGTRFDHERIYDISMGRVATRPQP